MPVKRKPKPPPPPPPFKPQKTSYSPPDLCWDIILTNPNTADRLTSWRWVWLLPQVARAFRAALQPDQWMMHTGHALLWKTKANALLALTAKDMASVDYTVVEGTGWYRRHETHLMRRDTLLQIALDKHGGTYKAINDVFLKRAEAKNMRKKRNRWSCDDDV